MERMSAPPEMNILIVDDRPENLLVLEELLQQPGRTFIRATSGNEALRNVLKYPIGLILLDVQMPDMDGFEVVSLLKANPATRDIPVIFLTAINKEEKYVLKGLEGGAIDYLYKPLNPAITKAKIQVFEQLYQSQFQIKKTNRELTDLNGKLNDLNEQKNYLLGMAAHDLRNPVAVISQTSEILLLELEKSLTPEQVRFIENIQRSSHYMLHLLEDLLDVSKIEAGKLSLNIRLTDIHDLIVSSTELNGHLAEKKNIRIERREDIQTLHVYLDPVKIEQVINNLLSNAIKFSPAGTTIHMEATEDNNQLMVRIQDAGPGIPEHEKKKLFKAFQTTSVQATAGEKSTGLGLMISERIIRAHGGTIGVDSVPGRGSAFYFQLPVSLTGDIAEHPETIKVTETDLTQQPAKPPDQPSGKIILVAEDDRLAQVIIKKMLDNLGYVAVVAENGEACVRILQENRVDLIFMDMNMPVMNGVEATRQIRKLSDDTKRQIPVIGLTASGIASEIETCLASGMNRCLKKPVMMHDLLATLKEVLS